MKSLGYIAFALLVFVLSNSIAYSQPRQVDVVMAIGLDNSGSMKYEELRLQVDGMANTVINPEIIRIFTSGRHGAIAIRFYSWSQTARILSDWIIVSSLTEAMILHNILKSDEFFAILYDAVDSNADFTGGANTPSRRVRSTDLNVAITMGVAIVRDGTYFGDRQVINIIGDGPDNIGTESDIERDLAYEEFGIMINGLVMTEEADKYYQDHVVTPNGFTVLVPDYPSFSKAMEDKFRDEMVYLLNEIAEELYHG